ncbi:MAG: DUF427 domain-containing protein [Actinomycetota bacterium]|nr:DUF427 domain-containing protein [Actinomycetota bacterium]
MSKAVWNGTVLAESDDIVMVEGNHYFPPSSLNREFFAPSDLTSRCPWKGTAGYYDVTVSGETNPSAAWFYAEPKPGAEDIKDRVAFWRGVRIEE